MFSDIFQTCNIMVGNRLLYQFQVILIQPLDQTDSLFCCPSLVRIHTNLNVIPNRFTNRFDSGNILRKGSTDFRLNCIKTIRHILSSLGRHYLRRIDTNRHIRFNIIPVSAQKLIDWHACFLAKKVITCHIDSILGTSRMRCGMIHRPVYLFQIRRINTNEISLHLSDHIACTG